jgi:hypothetical protein
MSTKILEPKKKPEATQGQDLQVSKNPEVSKPNQQSRVQPVKPNDHRSKGEVVSNSNQNANRETRQNSIARPPPIIRQSFKKKKISSLSTTAVVESSLSPGSSLSEPIEKSRRMSSKILEPKKKPEVPQGRDLQVSDLRVSKAQQERRVQRLKPNDHRSPGELVSNSNQIRTADFLNTKEKLSVFQIIKNLGVNIHPDWRKIASKLNQKTASNFSAKDCEDKFRDFISGNINYNDTWSEKQVKRLFLINNFWKRVSDEVLKTMAKRVDPSTCKKIFCEISRTTPENFEAQSILQIIDESDVAAREGDILVNIVKELNSGLNFRDWEKLTIELNSETGSQFTTTACDKKFHEVKKGKVECNSEWTQARIDMLFFLANNFWQRVSDEMLSRTGKKISSDICKKIFYKKCGSSHIDKQEFVTDEEVYLQTFIPDGFMFI